MNLHFQHKIQFMLFQIEGVKRAEVVRRHDMALSHKYPAINIVNLNCVTFMAKLRPITGAGNKRQSIVWLSIFN